jgi:hypothetical protein
VALRGLVFLGAAHLGRQGVWGVALRREKGVRSVRVQVREG